MAAACLQALALCSEGGATAFAASRLPGSRAAAPLPFGASGRRILVLTFDAAWAIKGADQILDTLASQGVRATFFLAGRFVRAHPDIARRIAAEGHEVGNHTFAHDHLTRRTPGFARGTRPEVSEPWLRGEMEAARRAWETVTGRALAPIWRAPYGETNDEILAWGRAAGYTHVGWSDGLDTLDWVSDPGSALYRQPREAAEAILGHLRGRSPRSGPAVVLLHLGSERPGPERFASALPALIEGARGLGYRFATAGDAMMEGDLP